MAQGLMHINDPKNIIEILGILGAFVMMFSVLLSWATVNLPVIGTSFDVTGWDLHAGSVDAENISAQYGIPVVGATEYDYAPLVVLICGILGIVSVALQLFSSTATANKVAMVVTIVLAVASIALAVLYSGDIASHNGEVIPTSIMNYEASYGVWVSVVGAAMVIVGGVGGLLKRPYDYMQTFRDHLRMSAPAGIRTLTYVTDLYGSLHFGDLF